MRVPSDILIQQSQARPQYWSVTPDLYRETFKLLDKHTKVLLWQLGAGDVQLPSLVQRSSGSPNILYPCSQANLTMSPYCRPTPIMKVCWGESRLGHQIPIDSVSYQAKLVNSLLNGNGVIVTISPIFCLTLTLRKTSRPGTVLHAGGTGCSVN